jgi:hypothetical protein
MASPVTLSALIQQVRWRTNFGGATAWITDAEITSYLNASLAHEVYDLVRQSVGDQYYRKSFTFTTNASQPEPDIYPLPGDFLDIISVDIYLSNTVGQQQPKVNARRYMESERNIYSYLPLGWSYGGTILYSLHGPSQIRFQPPPLNVFAVRLNYQPTSPQLTNMSDTWDDINGWSEIAILDAASKCCLKANRLDMVQAYDSRKAVFKREIAILIAMRHAGEPERPNITGRNQFGDGWEGGGWGPSGGSW